MEVVDIPSRRNGSPILNRDTSYREGVGADCQWRKGNGQKANGLVQNHPYGVPTGAVEGKSLRRDTNISNKRVVCQVINMCEPRPTYTTPGWWLVLPQHHKQLEPKKKKKGNAWSGAGNSFTMVLSTTSRATSRNDAWRTVYNCSSAGFATGKCTPSHDGLFRNKQQSRTNSQRD